MPHQVFLLPTLLTAIAAVEFYSHGDMAVPLFRVEANKTAFETGIEAIIHDCVPVTVTRKHLKKINNSSRSQSAVLGVALLVELALVCKAGGRGLDPQDQTNINNHKITEENLKSLKPSLQVVCKEGFQNA